MSEIRGEVWSIIRRAMDTPHADDFEAESAYRDAYASEAAEKVIALLADRDATVAEPDAETVEVRDLGSVLRLEYARGYGDAKREQQFNVVSSTTYQPIAAMPSGKDADDEPYLGPRDKGMTVKATVVEAEDAPMFPDLGADADNWLDEARVVEVSDMDGEYALIRVPVKASMVRMGAVNVPQLRDAVQKAKEASNAK